ncbi:hypothetical protein TRVA0_022S01750 [Trichomonascus vanleenenianus]|uniref:uncharacterized protein n=1 Tax=Trichomonascus vanleenenianus TaxID=2268995 RepID=UPI003ECA0862
MSDNNGNVSTGLSAGPSSVLFYVALGIGIVFANLFAFMGFRYFCRRRRHPEQFAAAQQQARTQYRGVRRKKKPKLMTMDEVNEKFPIMPFKLAKPNAAASSDDALLHRAPTVHEEDGEEEHKSAFATVTTVPIEDTNQQQQQQQTEQPTVVRSALNTMSRIMEPIERRSMERRSIDRRSMDRVSAPQRLESRKDDITSVPNTPIGTSFDKGPDLEAQTVEEEHASSSDSAEDEDEVPQLGSVDEDICAICIDAMEDHEDVRLLTCKHVFHAECIDPWLTVRRACCPLCKADYYIPKPEAQSPENDPSQQAPPPSRRHRALQNIFGMGSRRNRQQQEQPATPDPAHIRDDSRATELVVINNPQPQQQVQVTA